MPTEFKTLNTGTISSGSSAEKKWSPNKDITIKKVMLIERDDKSLSNVKVYISVGGVPYTKDYVPGSAIGSDPEYCYKPNIRVTKGSEIYFKIENNRTDSVNIDIVFEYE